MLCLRSFFNGFLTLVAAGSQPPVEALPSGAKLHSSVFPHIHDVPIAISPPSRSAVPQQFICDLSYGEVPQQFPSSSYANGDLFYL